MIAWLVILDKVAVAQYFYMVTRLVLVELLHQMEALEALEAMQEIGKIVEEAEEAEEAVPEAEC